MTRLIKALHCSNHDRPPVWLMRQAGRYLPDYRALRTKYRLWELFHSPELAFDVTQLPLRLFDLDAAILFSDILVIAEAFGLAVVFPEKGGPRIDPVVKSPEQIGEWEVKERLSYVYQTIKLLKPELKVPLIGFCGGPFTVAQYLTQDNNELSRHPDLLGPLTDASIAYLRLQIEAGVEVIQIFDSWANLLSEKEFEAYAECYLKKMVDSLRDTGVPVILFCRGSCRFANQLAALKPHGISLDWEKPVIEIRNSIPKNIALQGNFNPDLMRGSQADIKNMVKKTLEEMSGDPGYIANLGHGVLPDTPLENVRYLVDLIKYSPKSLLV